MRVLNRVKSLRVKVRNLIKTATVKGLNIQLLLHNRLSQTSNITKLINLELSESKIFLAAVMISRYDEHLCEII